MPDYIIGYAMQGTDLLREVERGVREGFGLVVTQPVDTETLEVLTRLSEAIYAPLDSSGQPNKPMKDAAESYNAHSNAAHRSSTIAYRNGGGNGAIHSVAASHHKLAQDAADKCVGMCPAGSNEQKDYQAASKYHKAQALAHDAASSTMNRGNNQPYNSYDSAY